MLGSHQGGEGGFVRIGSGGTSHGDGLGSGSGQLWFLLGRNDLPKQESTQSHGSEARRDCHSPPLRHELPPNRCGGSRRTLHHAPIELIPIHRLIRDPRIAGSKQSSKSLVGTWVLIPANLIS